jgi:cytidine deaminase
MPILRTAGAGRSACQAPPRPGIVGGPGSTEAAMDLLEAALRARAHAYAPYSGFAVGAAVRCGDGSIHAGCNVENVAFPEGTCAEAGAIAAMVASGSRTIVEALVVADAPDPVTPCGGCRQKLAEFAAAEVPVILAGPEGARGRTTVGALLPGAFAKAQLPGAAS